MFDIQSAQQVSPQTASPVAVEALLDRAFGSDRHGKASYGFRRGVEDVPGLRFLAVSGKRLMGTIRFWPVAIVASAGTSAETSAGTATPALLLGPLGVDPDCQNMGIGAALMSHGMNVARTQGHGLVLLVGVLDYYGRFGFGPARSRNITMPGEEDHRLLVRELQNDALNHVEGLVTSLAATTVPESAA